MPKNSKTQFVEKSDDEGYREGKRLKLANCECWQLATWQKTTESGFIIDSIARYLVPISSLFSGVHPFAINNVT